MLDEIDFGEKWVGSQNLGCNFNEIEGVLCLLFWSDIEAKIAQAARHLRPAKWVDLDTKFSLSPSYKKKVPDFGLILVFILLL